MPAPYTVALVADPEFGAQLLPLAGNMHVWAIDSPTNHSIAESWWKSQSPHGPASGITTFLYEPNEDLETWCRFAIERLDEHHGPNSGQPAYNQVEVIGVHLSPRLRDSFSELGFVEFQENPRGFIARKAGT